jgi:hypothetical protein
MATTKQLFKKFNVSASMAKRLAQLHAGITPSYGTSMSALIYRGMVAQDDETAVLSLTTLGIETIEGLRAAGW